MQKTIDPVTLEVIDHRLTSISDEMEDALLKSSFSTIVKEARDCTTAIFDAQGQTVAQALAIPIHLGTLMISVPGILEVFPISKMQEGDVYLANDPYGGGTHLPDITIVVPVLYQGEVVALCCSMVHHQDIGAMTPGVPTSSTSLYQEGLNLPPLKLYDAGQPVQVVHEIIRKNVRTPDLVIGDIRAQVAGGNVGKRRLLELINEYGKDVVLAAMNQLLDHAEVLTRQELERIPDVSHTFADYLDNDGVDLDKRIKIQATVSIRGSEFIVDFEGTSPQARGPLNCTYSSTLSAVCYVLRAITSTDIPNNAGAFRPIIINLPEASILNPDPPAPLSARACTVYRTVHAMFGALAKALPERVVAASGGGGGGGGPVIYFGGVDPATGEEYGTVELSTGGMGARPMKDGIDVIMDGPALVLNVPAEAIEMNFPIRVIRTELYNDSGGAGEYRGGLGLDKVLELMRGSTSATYRGERHFQPPWGLFGGLPGARGRGLILRKTGEVEEIPSKRDFFLNEGDRIHFQSPGGGGYGDPLKRKPESVLRDVLDRRVSLGAAAEDYGVVIDRESMAVDLEKTSQLREERKRQRGPVTWTYDRGPELGHE